MSGTAGIELMRRQYLQLIEPARLHVPPLDEMRLPDTQERIYKTMFDEDIGHLPPERYRIRILKRLLHAMEEAVQDPYEDEISDDLTVALGSLMFNAPNNSTPSAEEKSFVTYSLPDPLSSYLAPGITLLESRHLIAASGTTGLRTWEAALNLGQFLHTEAGSQLVRGKRVLELGAGTGFLSILLAKHLKSDFVLATDGSGQVIDDLSANLFLNGLEDERFFKAAVMKWGHALVDDMLSDTEGRDSFDVVIGADLVSEN
ncbi:hypothetical protein MMC25_003124 [Agyrium rufum]|nr:hypothetical protein [Agyrium rufum]